MLLEIAKVGVLLGGIALLAAVRPARAAGAVGIAFGFTAIAGVAMVVREGVSPIAADGRLPAAARRVRGDGRGGVAGRTRACRALGVRRTRPCYLVTEIVVGAIVYVLAALAIAARPRAIC